MYIFSFCKYLLLDFLNFFKSSPQRTVVVNLYKNQGNLHIHDSGKKEIQIKREKIYTNGNGCRDIHFGK